MVTSLVRAVLMKGCSHDMHTRTKSTKKVSCSPEEGYDTEYYTSEFDNILNLFKRSYKPPEAKLTKRVSFD